MANFNIKYFDSSADFNIQSFKSETDTTNQNVGDANDVNHILSDIFADFSKLFDALGSGQTSRDPNIWQGGCCTPPIFEDSCHPANSLKSDASAVTTPGGYRIESTGQYDWKITGPDGKVTSVTGDPHVHEGDGGKWDFKRDSTFVLGDGTKINVKTTPYGNGATVTSNLEIISGNDRINISDIEKGKGKIGENMHDGFSLTNSFGGKDVFVMGKESDDWAFQGREVTGSNNGGDSFRLGNDLPAGTSRNRDITPMHNFEFDWANFFKDSSSGVPLSWNNAWRPNQYGANPYYHGISNRPFASKTERQYDADQHRKQIMRTMNLVGRMFKLIGQINKWNTATNRGRRGSIYV